jgi:hypothetical protein
MTTVMVNIEEGHEEDLKHLLQSANFKAEIIQSQAMQAGEPESAYERLIKLQKTIAGKELFKEIKDPSEWQREIRKEWDRDF